jgi:K+-sensing histidine kinase KdpD
MKLTKNTENPQIIEIAKRIESQSDHLKKTVGQVLNSSSSEDPVVPNDREWVPVCKFLDEVCETWIRPHNLQIDFKDVRPALIHINRPLFEIVIGNLLDNALKYSANSEPLITFQGELIKRNYQLIICAALFSFAFLTGCSITKALVTCPVSFDYSQSKYWMK